MPPKTRRGVLRRAGGALAAATLTGAAGASRGSGVAERTLTDPITDRPATDPTTPSVEFDAQLVEERGRRVSVERAAVPDGGFVVIYEASVDDVIGKSAYLPPGVRRHVDVRHHPEERVMDRTELTAGLHRDTDGDEVFDFLGGDGDDGPYLVDDRPVYDTTLVFAPDPTSTTESQATFTPTLEPTPTQVPSDRSVTATPSPSPPSTMATEVAVDDVPGFGVGVALVAAGAGVLATWRRR